MTEAKPQPPRTTQDDRYGLALQAVALKAIAHYVTERLAEVKAEIERDVKPGERVPARLADGRKVGYVLRSEPKAGALASIVDPAAFTRWVDANYPTEVVPAVRPVFRDMVLSASREAGIPMSPNGEPDVPGVVVNDVLGAAVLSVRPDYSTLDEALPAVLAQLREVVVDMIVASPEAAGADATQG